MDVIERKSDGENYDYVIAELEATNETLLSNLGSDKSTLLKERDRLEAELIEREKILFAKEQELAAKQDELSHKDLQIDTARRELQDAAQETETLAKAKEQLEAERQKLAQRKAEIEQEHARVKAYLEKERQRGDELAKHKELTDKERQVALAKLAATQERMDSRLVGVGQGLQNIGDGLNKVGNELAVVGADVKVVGQGLADVRTEVSDVRTEVTDVRTEVTGVGVSLSEEIAGSDASQKQMLGDIIEKQPNTLNKIYTSYLDNVVTINLNYKHRGGFLGKTKSSEFQTETILLTDGSIAYALLHVQETPFRLRPSQRRLISVEGSITSDHLQKPIPLGQVAFLDDPRILIIPVFSPLKNLREAGLSIFEPVVEPHVFAEAVVIDSDDYNFGQTSFTRDPKNERYVRMQRKFFSFLRGEFEASEGDLVFSKTGQVLGIMVNDDYAFVFKDLSKKIRSESITYVGERFKMEVTMRTLASLGRSLSGVEEKFR